MERDLDPEHFLFERYAGSSDRDDDARPSALLRGYYTLRPLIPRRAQIAMRRLYARRQVKRPFPRWPIEPILVEHERRQLHEDLRRSGATVLPLVNYWPRDHRFAFVLTHDVEGPSGVANIDRVREVERRHGVVSSWNFCAEQYPIPSGLFDELRGEGCEIGLHGIDHRCRLFSSRHEFDSQLPKIRRYLEEWGAVGFRSPALHRNADWMPELGCLYDSSFPDTDPFEPQPGGCCSIRPFFNGSLVELPVTLVQDHTLFEILRQESIEAWVQKADWIRDSRGLVNVIVHPDYMLSDARLALYDQLVAHLTAQTGAWHGLPRDVAAWWRRRATSSATSLPDGTVELSGAEDAGVIYAREVDGELVVGAA